MTETEIPRAVFPTQAIFRRTVKAFASSSRHPYPVYAIDLAFRVQPRTLEYTLYLLDDGTVGCNFWLVCLGRRAPGADPDGSCTCCPELSPVELLRTKAKVAAHVMMPGKPARW